MTTPSRHRSVLLAAAVDGLAVRADGIYVDCTFGRGGHSLEILERLGDSGQLLALDRDPEAIAIAQGIARRQPRLVWEQANFAALGSVLQSRGLVGRVDGILFDLGVSSPQLDEAERGFSFMRDGPLDMRMDPRSGVSAAEWLRVADEAEIAGVLWRLGEERQSRRIARAIVAARQQRPLLRTLELAELIEAALGGRRGRRVHPATRSFQAIRMHINGELAAIEAALPAALEALAPGGRLSVISFHSLEDRMVKRFMRDAARPQPPDPVSPAPPPLLRLCGRHRAEAAELEGNPRARSAVLRVAEKVAA